MAFGQSLFLGFAEGYFPDGSGVAQAPAVRIAVVAFAGSGDIHADWRRVLDFDLALQGAAVGFDGDRAFAFFLGFDLAAGGDGCDFLVAGLECRFADFAGDLQLRGLAFDQGHAFLVEVRVLDGHLAFQGDAVCFDADRAGALFLCDDLAGG